MPQAAVATPQEQRERESALERFAAYARKLQELKEGNISDEFLHRELLVEFLRINAGNLTDLPPNSLQQVGVVNLLCQRAFRHPKYKNVDNIIQSLVADVARLQGTDPREDPDLHLKRFGYALNSELLLLRVLQSVVRVQADVAGTFRDNIRSLYGENGTRSFDEFYANTEFSPNFWRTVIEHFVKKKLGEAYDDVIRKAKYNYSRTPKSVRINFQFDLILEELSREGLQRQRSDKLRPYIQTEVVEFEYKRIRQAVTCFLMENRDFYLENEAPDSDAQPIIEMVCFDLSAAEYKQAALAQAMRSVEWEDIVNNEEQLLLEAFDTIKGKLLAAALGVSIAYSTIRRDFIEAVNIFSTKNMQIYDARDIEHTAELIRYFNQDALEATLLYMLESYFFNILRRKCMDKKEKIKIQSVHKKRIDLETLEQLYHYGLSRIQKNKIFMPDTYNPDMLEFRMVRYEDLERFYDFLQMPRYLRERMQEVWEGAANKIAFYVIIDLAMLTRTSTDIKRGLTEILYKYGIVV